MVADSAGGGAARLQRGRAVRVERGRGRQELQQTRAPGHSRAGTCLYRADTELLQVDQGGLTLTTRDQYINKTVEEDPVLGALLQVLYCTVLYCTVLYCLKLITQDI